MNIKNLSTQEIYEKLIAYSEQYPILLDEYKKSRFYDRRTDGMTDLLVEKGIINRAELTSRTQEILRQGLPRDANT